MIWTGLIVSMLLLIGEFNEIILNGEEIQETAVYNSQIKCEVILGGDNSIISLENKRTEHHISGTDSSSECEVSDGNIVPENASQELPEDETNLSFEIGYFGSGFII